jgi:hypothetical protein
MVETQAIPEAVSEKPTVGAEVYQANSAKRWKIISAKSKNKPKLDA